MRNLQSTLSYQWYQEVWNNGQESSIDKLLAQETEAKGLGISQKGPAGFKIFFNDFRNQFDNINITVDDVIAQDDMEAARCTVQAVHKASGRNIQFSDVSIVQIGNGQIVDGWNHFDFAELTKQLA